MGKTATTNKPKPCGPCGATVQPAETPSPSPARPYVIDARELTDALGIAPYPRHDARDGVEVYWAEDVYGKVAHVTPEMLALRAEVGEILCARQFEREHGHPRHGACHCAPEGARALARKPGAPIGVQCDVCRKIFDIADAPLGGYFHAGGGLLLPDETPAPDSSWECGDCINFCEMQSAREHCRDCSDDEAPL